MWYPVNVVTGVPSVFSVGGTHDSVAVPVGAVGDALTVTVALWTVVPPLPVQLNVYAVVALRALVDIDPLVAWEPLQPPDAVHEVAFVAAQLKVAVAPLFTVLGLADNVTAGAGAVGVWAAGAEVAGAAAAAELMAALELVWFTDASDPHPASAESAVNPTMNFNTRAGLKRPPRRMEIIMCLPINVWDDIFVRFLICAKLSLFANAICCEQFYVVTMTNASCDWVHESRYLNRVRAHITHRTLGSIRRIGRHREVPNSRGEARDFITSRACTVHDNGLR
jgi:hypothetical protein